MIPLTIRAHLAVGVAMNSWGIALDGLLASAAWSRTKTAARDAGNPLPDYGTTRPPTELDLPLATCSRAGQQLWHWASTTAWPEPRPDRPDLRIWTGRPDHRHLEQAADWLPKVISARQGRYRTRRMPLIVIPCRSVSWLAIGDPDLIEDLLTDLSSIGKKRSSGEGQVMSWEITPNPDRDHFTASHLHPDGTLGRTCDPACLAGTNIEPPTVTRAGLRPPYLHPDRQHTVCVPATLA